MNVESYVENELKLRTQPRELQTGDAGLLEAAVVGGSVLATTSQLTVDQRSDVYHSLLLAQLAATGKCDRFKEIELWFGEYVTVLQNTGWITNQQAFGRVRTANEKLRMDVTALQAIGKIASSNGLNVLQKSLSVLESLPSDDNAIALFDSKATLTESGSFQLGNAEIGDDGAVSLCLGAFHFKANVRRQRFLFFEWDSQDVEFWAAIQVMKLNNGLSARDTIRKRLNNYVDDYIWSLKLPEDG